MKRKISILLALLLAFCLTACGDTQSGGKPSSTSTSSQGKPDVEKRKALRLLFKSSP